MQNEDANPINDTIYLQPESEADNKSTIKIKRPDGTIRYMYAICDDKGRYCENEIGKIEATISNIILPDGETAWKNTVREAGNAVANEMRNSRHKMPATSLIKINIQRKNGEKETVRAREEERAEASQE